MLSRILLNLFMAWSMFF